MLWLLKRAVITCLPHASTHTHTSTHVHASTLTHTQGGFAHCYELIDMDTNGVFAGKIVPKTMLTKPHQREKMTMEIEIHRSLSHKHIVGFHGFFEVWKSYALYM